MTQELYKSRRELEVERNETLAKSALTLWRNHAEPFRTLPDEYHSLLHEKEERKIFPLKKLSAEVLNEYPDVPFFNIVEERDAVLQIKKWASDGTLSNNVRKIQNALESYYYKTMKSWVVDNRYVISKKEYKDAKRASMRQSGQ